MALTWFESATNISCTHEYKNTEGLCTRCGLLCQTFEETTGDLKVSSKSIRSDMENLPVPEDIKSRAELIFLRLKAVTKRGNRRKQLVFFCIYEAYKEVGTPQDPKKIASVVGIKSSEMTKALSMFSEVQTGYKSKFIHVDPKDLLPGYAEQLTLPKETIEELLKFAEEIINKDPELKEKFPQKVASGILKYYLEINGATLNMKEYAKIIQLSEVTINSMYKSIVKIHNSV